MDRSVSFTDFTQSFYSISFFGFSICIVAVLSFSTAQSTVSTVTLLLIKSLHVCFGATQYFLRCHIMGSEVRSVFWPSWFARTSLFVDNVFFARCYDGSRSIVFNCCLGLLASCERYLKVCCFLGYLDTSWYLRFEERLGYLNAETKEKFSQMARKKFKAMNGNTSSIIDMVQKAHFTNVFHYHDRHNVCLRKIGNCVSHRDFVVLVALCHSASSVLLWLCEMSQCHKQKLDFSLLLSRLHDE